MTPTSITPIPGDSEQAFMRRVRSALGRPHGQPGIYSSTPVAPAASDALARLQKDVPHRAALFTAAAIASGMVVYPARTAAQAHAVLIDLLRAADARSVLINAASPDAELLLSAALGASVQILNPPEPAVDPFTASAGLTDTVAAIAETGSLVVRSWAGPGGFAGRLGFILPPLHVAIVRTANVVADLLDLWPFLGRHGHAGATAITLVTGPSKTADIEGVLVTGVHGPGRVEIVLIEE